MDLDVRFQFEQRRIDAFETDYKLPPMNGTPRQEKWARIIRHELLPEVFAGLMTVTQPMSAPEAQSIYRLVDKLRAEPSAKAWIEHMRPLIGKAWQFLPSYAAQLDGQAARKEQKQAAEIAASKERQRKSQESRRLTKEATEFEKLHGLPELVAFSTPQRNFGRRCRFQFLKDLSAEDLTAMMPVLTGMTVAGVWIGGFTKGTSLDQLIVAFQNLSQRHDDSVAEGG